MSWPRSRGALSPFYLACAVPRRRHDLLLSCAVDWFERGDPAAALLAVEYVCRGLPRAGIPAILRAKIVQSVLPERAADAWHAAWACDPEQIALQDMLLRVLLAHGATADAIGLGLAFLPERCRDGQHATLVALLHAAGLARFGACWKDAGRIAATVFAPPATPRLRIRVQDEHGHADYDVPADGRRFHLPVARPGGVWSLALALDAETLLLAGSPLSFDAPSMPDPPPIDAAPAGAPRRPVAIVLPVYRGLAQVRACIDSVLASLKINRGAARLLVIDDASPEPELSAWLATLADTGRLTLLRNPYNLGFIATVNRGLRHCADADALLLNADTLVHGDWIDRLAAALDAAPDIAAVSPWSNNGEITSYPTIGAAAPMPAPALLARIDKTAATLRRAAGSTDVDLPACCGFAMLMRRAVIDRIGVLDGAALRRGYGEEVDWCLRARAAGYRLLAATGVYVAHAGGVSFRHEKPLRVRQNRAVLGARYPGYFDDYQRFLRHDPLAAMRARLAAALYAAGIAAPAHAPPPRIPAPLPRAAMRIGVWRYRAGAAYAPQILHLARLLAGRAAQATPPPRLLVLGDAPEALWRTGVVDVLPDQSDADALFDDATLLGLAGCAVLLAAPGAVVPDGLPVVRLTAGFDAAAWLAAWAPPLEEALQA